MTDAKGSRGEPAFGIEHLIHDDEMFLIGEGPKDVRLASITTSPLNQGTQLTRVGLRKMKTRPENLQEIKRCAGPSFLQQRHDPFL